jgi:hypothetical protein
LHAVKQVLLGSDAIAPLMLSGVAEEITSGTLVPLATEPWAFTGYGLVRLKTHAPGAAASRFCECLRDAEAALVRSEPQLLAAHPPMPKAPPAPRTRRG